MMNSEATNINAWREDKAFEKFRAEIRELYRQQIFTELNALRKVFGPRAVEPMDE